MAHQPIKDYPAPPSSTATAPVGKAPVSRDFGSARQSYGGNQYGGPSSVNPGKSVSSALAYDLKRSGTDGTLDRVIAHGTRCEHDPNVNLGETALSDRVLREGDHASPGFRDNPKSRTVPTSVGHKPSTPNPANVPSKTGGN